jgi:hypothetical protein
MRFAYKLTATDLVEAQRKHGGLFTRLVPVWGVCLLVAGVIWIFLGPKQDPTTLIPAVIGIVLGMFGLFGWELLIKQAFRRDTRLQQPFEAIVSDNGIDVSSPTSSGQFKWSAFTRYVETKNLFLVYQSQNAFNIFPKRAFPSGEEEAFRHLLADRLRSVSADHDKKVSPQTLIFWLVIVVAAVLLWIVIRKT